MHYLCNMHIFGKNKIFALIALCAIIMQGCVKERKFVVDEGLLEKTATENNIGIDYQMPAGFSAIRQGMVDTIAVQEQQHDPFSGRIAAIYVDTLLGNSIVMITDMAAVPAERTENKLDFYFTEFNIGKTWDKVEIQRYRFGDFPKVVQLDMYNDSKYNIKLYFYDEDKARFSVDYLFDTGFYNDLKPFIDASVGSFRKHREITITTDNNETLQ